MIPSRLALRLAIGCTLACTAGLVNGQDFPSKPIRLIVPNSPGTPPDIVARTIASEMSRPLGQPIVVENRTGADGIIGYEYVAKQVPADGYTLALASLQGLAILPATVKELRFDPLRDLPAIMIVSEGRFILGSSSKLPWKRFGEMVVYAKANPGKLNYGAATSQVRFPTEALVKELALAATFIPYREGTVYLQALVNGDIHFGFLAEAPAIGFGERFRVLAVTGTQRAAAFPDAPTFSEIGFPQIRGLTYTLNAPAGIPKAAADKLYAAAASALKQPDTKAHFAKLRQEILEQGAEVGAKRLVEESRVFADIAKKAGIQPQ